MCIHILYKILKNMGVSIAKTLTICQLAVPVTNVLQMKTNSEIL